MTTTDLLRISLSLNPNRNSTHLSHSNTTLSRPPQLPLLKIGRKAPNIVLAKAAPQLQQPPPQAETLSSVLLDVTGMMCGGCASRVKSILFSDHRVDSAAVNMLTATAAIRLKPLEIGGNVVAEELARRLTECGFPSKRRVKGEGVEDKVRKWKEMAEKKEELLVKSRNRLVFAWTLVGLCCGSHASHVLHSLGIHVPHGKLCLNLQKNGFKLVWQGVLARFILLMKTQAQLQCCGKIFGPEMSCYGLRVQRLACHFGKTNPVLNLVSLNQHLQRILRL